MNTLDDVGSWVQRRGYYVQNREGLTYAEWLRAAGALDSTGRRAIDSVLEGRRHHGSGSKPYSSILRKEWRHGVDPTEWRNYFDDEYATLESWRAYKRESIRAAHAAARLDGTYPPKGQPVGVDIERPDFFVSTSFRVSAKQKRTDRWWERPH